MISIIVPVYKVEPYLRQCVESILNQTYRDIEVLLIDDGSPDRCGEICDEYARKDNRVRAFHTENQGLSAARNLGISEAKGKYIGFVDSDDWIEPDMYEVLLRRMQETGAEIGVCGLWYEFKTRSEEAKNVVDRCFIGSEAIDALVLNNLKDFAWNKLYHKNIWNTVSFPMGHVFEDVATTYKAILNARTVISTSKSLYHYRQRAVSIGATQSMNNLIDFWAAYHHRYLDLSELPQVRKDQVIIKNLQEQVANGAVRTWWWVHKIPKKLRDQDHLNSVSAFVKNNFAPFGDSDWKAYLRISVFLARYVNEFSFAAGYYMNWFYRTVWKHKRACVYRD